MPLASRGVAALGLLSLWIVAPARADEEALMRRIEQLEQRVQELETEAQDREESSSPFDAAYEARQRELAASAGADWTRFVRLGGSANVGYFDGGDDSLVSDLGFEVWDARFFVDAELGRDVEWGDTILARDIGFTFEWDLVRLGDLDNRVGELFVEFQGMADSDWANMQVGRFEIPVGEAYLRYSKGYAHKPFISNALGGPWFWDEGVKLYGAEPEGRFGYFASVSDGDTAFGEDSTGDKQVTLKLFAQPTPWLHVSVSGLRTGKLGNSSRPASGAIWLGEAWARAFGASSDVPNYIDGVVEPDGPNKLRDSYLGAADVVLEDRDWGRLWLAYGAYYIDSRGPGFYDRTLHYWIAEAILEGRRLSEALEPFYAGFRASGIGTYDDDRGYLLDFRYDDDLGWNMRSLQAYSAVLGWRITRWLRLKAEYTYQDIDLVDGVTADISRHANDADYFAIELSANF